MARQEQNPDNPEHRSQHPQGPDPGIFDDIRLPRSYSKNRLKQQIEIENGYAHELLDLISGHRWKDAEVLLHSAVREESRFDISLSNIVNYHPPGGSRYTPLLIAARGGAPKQLVSMLLDLGAETDATVNFFDKSAGCEFRGMTALHFAARNRDFRLVNQLLRAGANPDAATEDGHTALHFVFQDPQGPVKLRIASSLLAYGADINARARETGTCLEHCLYLSGRLPERLQEIVRERNLPDPDPDAVSKRYSTRNSVEFLLANGALLNSRPEAKSYSIDHGAGLQEIAQRDLVLGIEQKLSRLSAYEEIEPEIRDQAFSIFRSTESPMAMMLYLEAFDGATDTEEYPRPIAFGRKPKDESAMATRLKHTENTALSHLARHLLFDLPQSAATLLVRRLELTMDLKEDLHGWHPNEAELLLLMNHPRNQALDHETINPLTASYTSIFRFLDYDVPVHRQTVRNWGRIANLCFSFQHWRYDAQAITRPLEGGLLQIVRPSLLEQMHFQRIASRVTDYEMSADSGKLKKLYGSGFSFVTNELPDDFRATFPQARNLDNFYFELRQAYILVSHPGLGTLLLRNSSPAFGRHAFRHPAYYSEYGIHPISKHTSVMGARPYFSRKELQDLDPDMVRRYFVHIGDIALNRNRMQCDQTLDALVSAAESLQKLYASWKFDTYSDTAWMDFLGEGRSILIGGHRSHGFRALTTQLAYLFNQADRDSGRELPALAFTNPKYPPWRFHPYQDPVSKQVERKFILTAERIDALLELAHSRLYSKQVKKAAEQSGLASFLSQAGLQHPGSQLLMVSSPVKPTGMES